MRLGLDAVIGVEGNRLAAEAAPFDPIPAFP
jgi:hypothetical protein